MTLQTPEPRKLLISAALGIGGVVAVLALKWLFPSEDLSGLQGAVLAAISAWIINTMRESLS